MLPHYSPLSVAERFSILSGLYPGRVDLGIGRAPGTDQLTMLALQRDRRQACPGRLPRAAHRAARLPRGPHARGPSVRPPLGLAPGRARAPEVWLLGSSPQSAIWAGELGIPYSFADFINPRGAEIADRVPARASRTAAARPRRRSWASGRSRSAPTRTRRPSGCGERPHVVLAAAPGPPDPGAAGREGAALPRDARADARRQAGDHRLAGQVRGDSRPWRASTARRR